MVRSKQKSDEIARRQSDRGEDEFRRLRESVLEARAKQTTKTRKKREGGLKKKRYKGRVFKEMRSLQKHTDLLINKAPFVRLVRQITAEVEWAIRNEAEATQTRVGHLVDALGNGTKSQVAEMQLSKLTDWNLQYRWKQEAILALQEASETYITEVRAKIMRPYAWPDCADCYCFAFVAFCIFLSVFDSRQEGHSDAQGSPPRAENQGRLKSQMNQAPGSDLFSVLDLSRRAKWRRGEASI